MADITLTCGTCGNRITVSEYVEAEFLTCLKCRTKVPMPRAQPEQPATVRLKLAAPPPPPPEPPPPATTKGRMRIKAKTVPVAAGPGEDVRQNTPFMKRLRKRRRRTSGMGVIVAAYGLGTVLAGVLLYLRFVPGALPGGRMDLLVGGALWALALMHLSVIACAFADDAFHGVLSILIPGYTIYFLYVHSDRIFQQAVATALLLAFGLDAAQAVSKTAHGFYVSISAWMQDAGPLKSADGMPAK